MRIYFSLLFLLLLWLKHAKCVKLNPLPSVSFGERWTLRVNTQRYGQDFITFFATDDDRPLEYSCAYSTATCNFTVIKQSNDDQQEAIVHAHIDKLYLAVPTMSGRLMICTGPVYMFWKRPLMATSDYHCKRIHPHQSLQERTIFVPPRTRDRGREFIVRSEPLAIEGTELNVHTWYMTKENYRDMHLGRVIKVNAPLLNIQNRRYTLFLYASVFSHLNKFDCSIKGPSGDRYKMQRFDWGMLRYPIISQKENSGVYSVRCYSRYNDVIDNRTHIKMLIKSLDIQFITVPKITLKDYSDFIKVLPPDDSTSISIIVNVYTTSPLTSFRVTEVNRDKYPSKISIVFISSSPYDIVSKHNVSLSWLNYKTSGTYKINIVNKENESATQEFIILKAKSLKVIVNPSHLVLSEGNPAEVLCVGLGNLIEDMKWARDYKKIDNTIRYRVTNISSEWKESNSTLLIFDKVEPKDSGLYECTVSNRFEKVVGTVKLIIWPQGSPYLPNHDDTDETSLHNIKRLSGPNVLDISDEEIEREYYFGFKTEPPIKKEKSLWEKYHLLTILVLVPISCVCSICFVAFVIRRKKSRSEEKEKLLKIDISSEEENAKMKGHVERKRKRKRKSNVKEDRRPKK